MRAINLRGSHFRFVDVDLFESFEPRKFQQTRICDDAGVEKLKKSLPNLKIE